MQVEVDDEEDGFNPTEELPPLPAAQRLTDSEEADSTKVSVNSSSLRNALFFRGQTKPKKKTNKKGTLEELDDFYYGKKAVQDRLNPGGATKPPGADPSSSSSHVSPADESTKASPTTGNNASDDVSCQSSKDSVDFSKGLEQDTVVEEILNEMEGLRSPKKLKMRPSFLPMSPVKKVPTNIPEMAPVVSWKKCCICYEQCPRSAEMMKALIRRSNMSLDMAKSERNKIFVEVDVGLITQGKDMSPKLLRVIQEEKENSPNSSSKRISNKSSMSLFGSRPSGSRNSGKTSGTFSKMIRSLSNVRGAEPMRNSVTSTASEKVTTILVSLTTKVCKDWKSDVDPSVDFLVFLLVGGVDVSNFKYWIQVFLGRDKSKHEQRSKRIYVLCDDSCQSEVSDIFVKAVNHKVMSSKFKDLYDFLHDILVDSLKSEFADEDNGDSTRDGKEEGRASSFFCCGTAKRYERTSNEKLKDLESTNVYPT